MECFDLLHVGHLRHLQEAASMGDRLVVGLTMDSYIEKGDGRPVIPQEERRELLLGLRCVAEVMLCRNSIDALERARARIFCKGHDYYIKGLLDEEMKYCKEHDIEIRFTGENPQTTSAIIERIKHG